MNTNSIQQEILVVTGTTFSTRQWSEKDPGKQNNFSEKEQLEEACWNGLLYELLPEAYSQPADQKKLFLWQIKEGKSFIDLELGEEPFEIDTHFSIDPYSFMRCQHLS